MCLVNFGNLVLAWKVPPELTVGCAVLVDVVGMDGPAGPDIRVRMFMAGPMASLIDIGVFGVRWSVPASFLRRI